MSHTPGPWHRCGGPVAGYKIISKSTKEIVLSDNEIHCGIQHDANARLITAAPDLFNALKRLVACPDLCLDALEDDTVQRIQQAQKVINRVEGKTNDQTES